MSDRKGHHIAAAPGAALPLPASAEQQCKLDIFREEQYLKTSIWRSQSLLILTLLGFLKG